MTERDKIIETLRDVPGVRTIIGCTENVVDFKSRDGNTEVCFYKKDDTLSISRKKQFNATLAEAVAALSPEAQADRQDAIDKLVAAAEAAAAMIPPIGLSRSTVLYRLQSAIARVKGGAK